LPQLFGFLWLEIRGTRRGDLCRPPRQIGGGGALLHIGVRAICAGIAAVGIGVALESVGRYAVDAASAVLRAESPSDSVAETIQPKSFERRASLVHVASLETDVAFTSALGASDPRASFGDRFLFDQEIASFGERFLFDQKLASFDDRFLFKQKRASFGQRFVLASAGTEEDASSVLTYAALPSADPGDRAIARSVIGPSAPKSAPAASSAPTSVVKKRVASLEAPKDASALTDDDKHTAIYDIAARTVFLPNGRRLEAHSGLGGYMDDVRYVNLRARGPTPPNVYKLTMREELFHGVRAIRLTPVGDGKMFGREGLLAHSYMLGPNGQSNGCVSFNDYDAFLNAYLRGEVDRLVVVEHLDSAPTPTTASGWSLMDLFRRS
jgi:Protein of unknown function (DUF2778)